MFHGSMVALVTPMQENGEVDFTALGDLVEWHIEQKTDAIVVAGTTGESGTLTAVEKLAVIRFVEKQVKERLPVIAGSYAAATQQAIDMTQQAMEAGVDACLIMTPAYIKPTQEGLYQHYKAIAEAVAIPQIVYSVPGRTACDILPETVARLATISNIIGIKEATGSLDRTKMLLESCNGKIDVYSGEDSLTVDLMYLGAKGVISVTANVAPRLMHDMCAAALKGDFTFAQVINQRLMPLHQQLFVESNPIPVKWVLHKMGKIADVIRMPMTTLSAQYHHDLQKIIDEVIT